MTNLNRRSFFALSAGAAALGLGAGPTRAHAQARRRFPFVRTDRQWRQMLSADAYAVLRGHGTERPGSSPLDNEHRRGTFACAGCAQPLFAAETKFDSGTGWPSFWQPLPNAVNRKTDSTLGMDRTEVHCRRCGGHLGHVFNDGPRPTGLRYCMNGVAMKFVPAKL